MTGTWEIQESSGSKSNVDQYNFDDPLFLHPSDNGVVSIISIKFTGPNLEKLYDKSFEG